MYVQWWSRGVGSVGECGAVLGGWGGRGGVGLTLHFKNLVGFRVLSKHHTVESQDLLRVNSAMFFCFALEKQRRLNPFICGQSLQK